MTLPGYIVYPTVALLALICAGLIYWAHGNPAFAVVM